MNRAYIKREGQNEAGRLAVLFSCAVIEEMDRQKLSRYQLAQRMGVSKQAVYAQLDGERPITMLTMGKFAAALGVYFEIRIKPKVRRTSGASRSRRCRGAR